MDCREESRENPDWHNSRRAIGDFIGVCLQEEVNVPLSARGQLAQMLEMLCTQFDSWLDRGRRVLLNGNDPLTEGINNTRSFALLAFDVLWASGYVGMIQNPKVPEVATIIEKRFALQTAASFNPAGVCHSR